MKRVLLVGAGGLGSPVALLLARLGGVSLAIIDDDVVERSNLHRQTLYGEADVGRPKIERAAARIRAEAEGAGVRVEVETIDGRFVPENAIELAKSVDLVVEGADNLATKFLVADAAFLTRRSAVHAGVVRWSGWTLASTSDTACLRCLFEDIPRDRVETCAESGVVGPLVGVLGALQAAYTIRLLAGDRSAAGEVTHVLAKPGRVRRAQVKRRGDCPLCSTRSVRTIEPERYGAERCDVLDGITALREHREKSGVA